LCDPNAPREYGLMNPSLFTPDARFQPWWWEAAAPARTPERSLPKTVDVLIVGAGYTGLSAALTLARAGRSVLVLDAGDPGQGASTRNGGMIGSGHRVGFDDLAGKYGQAAAIAILKEGLAALDYTTDLIGREKIDCQFTRSGRFRAATRPADYEAMAREIERLRSAIGLQADVVPHAEQHTEIGSDAYHGGCVYHRHGGLHPALFHKGLLQRAVTAGAEVIGRTAVTRIERSGHGFSVTTAAGTVAAHNVAIVTNGYTDAAAPALRRRVVPVASYIIATEPLAAEVLTHLIPRRRMIVETHRRHGYYRISPDGQRLLFGGRAALRLIDTRASAARLLGFVQRLFPELAGVRVAHSWTGFVAFSRDGLPHIGVCDGVHYAMAYCGSGVAMAPYLGYKVAHKILATDEGASAFDRLRFSAIPLYGGYPWFLPLIESYYRLLDRLGD
jgi:glycine/D-amino acid oxidase-like deaminating enzyme